MATLILSTVGKAFGGPIGSTIGALVGNTIDRAVFGQGSSREGPRLKELSVSTSSYGTPIARQFGKVRVPGSVIWSTDLVETSEKEGGGKNRPSSVTYSYSVSFAVALSSRPITDVGRIWADGNLLRGAAGDLKVGGMLRVHHGHGDQRNDPLIASAKGDLCPAFRGIAYCVFEALELAEFGNRIPALSFEVIADNGSVNLVDLIEPAEIRVSSSRNFVGMLGYSDEGGPMSAHLERANQLYPMSFDCGGGVLSIAHGVTLPTTIPELSQAVVDGTGESFGQASGKRTVRTADASAIPDCLRHYDPDRDYQPGVQRADGRARAGRQQVVEFPATMQADTARGLINAAAEREIQSRETLSWRVAEVDPAITPGSFVRVPGRKGVWIVDDWEWRDVGIELSLRRVPVAIARSPAADSGTVASAFDYVATPTLLQAFELPWSGAGSSSVAEIFAAPSSASRGWTGAALFAVEGETLVPLENARSRRCTTGVTLSVLPPSPALIVDRQVMLEVQLDSPDFVLRGATPRMLAQGMNRAVLGTEIIQFARAELVGNGVWRLSGILRGRGASEAEALASQAVGSPFALIDDGLVRLDPADLGAATRIAAVGLADAEAVEAEIKTPGRSLRPISPVHPTHEFTSSGGLKVSWTRRARGAWNWLDEVEVPIVEERERYIVGAGPLDAPMQMWTADTTRMTISSTSISSLRQNHPGLPVWVRQQGKFALSDALLLINL